MTAPSPWDSSPRDWEVVRRRLDALARRLAGPSEPTPEQVRETLEARARALAAPARSEPAGEHFEAVVFRLGGETYGLEATLVWEVFPLAGLAPLPGADPPVFGLTAWRGTLLTLLDLRAVLGVPSDALTDLSRVILLGTRRPEFGVLADSVAGVVRLRREDVHEAPVGVAERREYLQGVTADAVLLLAGAALLRRHSPPGPRGVPRLSVEGG